MRVTAGRAGWVGVLAMAALAPPARAQGVGRPTETFDRMKALEENYLLNPWGLVENFTPDLKEALPVRGWTWLATLPCGSNVARHRCFSPP